MLNEKLGLVVLSYICSRLMNQHEVIINNILDTFIEMNKGTVNEENINMHYDKHMQILNKMDHEHCCTKSLNITVMLISKNNHVYSTMLL